MTSPVASKLAIAPYSLKLKKAFVNSATTARSGALLRVETESGFGYADIFTWPELGDATLQETIESLRAIPNAIAAQSLGFAYADAEFGAQKKAAFAELEVPTSHYLIEGSDVSAQQIQTVLAHGFTAIKLKVTNAVPRIFREAEPTQFRGLKFRFDFNAKLTRAGFESWVETLGARWFRHVDFIEDPTVYDANTWLNWNERFGLRLALDRAPLAVKAEDDLRNDKGPAPFTTVIVKPAIEDETRIRQAAALNMRRLVYTHNLDHPLGRTTALWAAARALTEDPLLVDVSGFAGDNIYETNAYFEAMGSAGAQLNGTGAHWGFADLLKGESWSPIG